MRRPTVAFGPVRDGFGSWEWVGVELAEALSPYFDVTMFRDDPPKTQAAVFVKFPPPTDWLPRLESTRIIYCPVDFFGSAKEIDQYSALSRLLQCDHHSQPSTSEVLQTVCAGRISRPSHPVCDTEPPPLSH